jgi:hypothetical protein
MSMSYQKPELSVTLGDSGNLLICKLPVSESKHLAQSGELARCCLLPPMLSI